MYFHLCDLYLNKTDSESYIKKSTNVCKVRVKSAVMVVENSATQAPDLAASDLRGDLTRRQVTVAIVLRLLSATHYIFP